MRSIFVMLEVPFAISFVNHELFYFNMKTIQVNAQYKGEEKNS